MSFDKQAWSQQPEQQAARRAYAALRREQHLAYTTPLKLEAGCADCGYRDDPAKLHFDHRPGTVKRYSIACMTTHTRSAVDAEIAKCDVRCVWCHERRHREAKAA